MSYWASPVEAQLCKNEEIALVGGGNSAGQAIVFLSGHVKTVHVVIRGTDIAASMSRYLADRIAALPNVMAHTESDVLGLDRGPGSGLTGATFRDRRTGDVTARALRHLFLFVGAEPNTDWLAGTVELDEKGFVLTDSDLPDNPKNGSRASLETSRSRVFAMGMLAPGRQSALLQQLATGLQSWRVFTRFRLAAPNPDASPIRPPATLLAGERSCLLRCRP